MGLENPNKNTSYLYLYNGYITQGWTSNPPAEFDNKRVNRGGNEVWERYYKQLSGYLVDIKLKLPPEKYKEYSANWEFTVVDEDHTYILRINAESYMADSIMARLMNINYSTPVQFKSWLNKGDNDKEYTNITIMQKYRKVDPWITEKEQRGKPDVKEIKSGKKIYYDHTERIRFFGKMIKNEILPKIFDQNPGAVIESGNVPEPLSKNAGSTAGLSTQEDLNLEHFYGEPKREMAKDARNGKPPLNLENDDLPF